MDAPPIDDVDAGIIHHLQDDARHTTNAEIADRLGVSASTVGNRLDRLEAAGIVQGYRPTIDLERVGYPHRVLFVCTASIQERGSLAERALAIEGVVHVRELVTGERNVHARAVGSTDDEIARIARELDALGLAVSDGVLLREEGHRPAPRFAEP